MRTCPGVGRCLKAVGDHPGERPQAEHASFHSLKFPLNAENQIDIFCRSAEAGLGRRAEFGEDINKRSW